MDTRNESPVLSALLSFLEQPEKCDVKFNVHLRGDAWMPFWGHKIVLSIWSPVFATHFSEKKNDESFSQLDIDCVSPTVFKHFLRFMYGSSEGIYENKNNGKLLLDLYKLAELYQVEQLKKDCRKILIAATVEVENVFQFLNAANYLDLEIVKLRCFELIRDKTAEVIAAQDLNKFTSFMVCTILKLDTLSLLSEYELLSWVFDWAESERVKSPQTDPQEIIKPFLPCLNFASLEAEQFAVLVNKHKEFFDDSDGFKIFLNICNPGSNCMPLPAWHEKAENFRSYKTRNCEVLSENLLSNDTQKDTKPVELCSNLNTVADPTEFANQSVNVSNSKLNVSSSNDQPAVDKASFKNSKAQKYHMGMINSISSLEQISISLSESSSLNQVPTHQCEEELNHYSLNDYSTDNTRETNYSKLGRIKKKKAKKWFLLQGGKCEPHTNSIDAMAETYSSGDFQSLVGLVWKQHRLSNV